MTADAPASQGPKPEHLDTIPMEKATDMVTTALISSICLLLYLLNLGGPDHIFELLKTTIVTIAIIATMSGVIRLFIPRKGWIISLVVGGFTASAGYLACLCHAVSRI